nr:hypothetical protein Iba_chr10dCG2730 [Ipomoea batatas]
MSVKAVADIAFLSWLQIQRIESNEQTEQYTQESDTYREKCNGPGRAGPGLNRQQQGITFRKQRPSSRKRI